MDKTLDHDQVDTKQTSPLELEASTARQTSSKWRDYISVTKTGIIIANLMTVVAGMWLAAGGASAFFNLSWTILFTLVGSAFIIASGAAFNNYYDRDIDQKMERTKDRALADGRLQPQQVLWLGIILGIAGTAALIYVNLLTALIALVGLFGYAVVYTMWVKRTHHLNTLVGSIPGAVPPLIGWAAASGTLEMGAWILFMIMFLWQPPHFFALAMRRCEDYRAAGIPMLPVVHGFEATKKQMILFTIALLLASLSIATVTELGFVYVSFAVVLGGIWVVLSLKGLPLRQKKEQDIKWANQNFGYSLIYLTALFAGMIVLTTF